MPTLRIGVPCRDQQVQDLFMLYAPISSADLGDIYEEKYGIKSAVAQANLFSCIEKYFVKGMFVLEQESLAPRQFIRMNDILTEDFYMLADVQKLFLQEFPNADVTLLNAYNLRELGYDTYSTYIIRKTYGGAVEYYRSLLLTEDIVDTNSFPDGILSLNSFSSELYSLRQDRKIIEYTPRQYINIRRLEQNGVTVEMLDNYCAQVERFVDTQYHFMQLAYQTDTGEWSLDSEVYQRLKDKEQTMLNAIDNHLLEIMPTSDEDLELIFAKLF